MNSPLVQHQETINRSLALVVEVVHKLTSEVGGGRMTLEPDATESQVLGMLKSYGKAHLLEAADALVKLPSRLVAKTDVGGVPPSLDLGSIGRVIEVNCGAAATAALVAHATGRNNVSVSLIDYAEAATVVGQRLLAELGIFDVSRHVVTLQQEKFVLDQPIVSDLRDTMIVMNHAANVNWRTPNAQERLEMQNSYVITQIAQSISEARRCWLLYVDASAARCLPDQILTPMTSETNGSLADWEVKLATSVTRVDNRSVYYGYPKKTYLYAMERKGL